MAPDDSVGVAVTSGSMHPSSLPNLSLSPIKLSLSWTDVPLSWVVRDLGGHLHLYRPGRVGEGQSLEVPDVQIRPLPDGLGDGAVRLQFK